MTKRNDELRWRMEKMEDGEVERWRRRKMRHVA